LDVLIELLNVSYQFGIHSSIVWLEKNIKTRRKITQKQAYLVEHIEDYQKRQNLKGNKSYSINKVSFQEKKNI
jgi:hypothetical protein